MPHTLRSQLTLVVLTLLLTIIAVTSLAANHLLKQEFDTYIAKQDEARCEAIVSDLSAQYNGMLRGWDGNFLHTIGMYSLYSGFIIKVYDANGGILWDAENHDMTLCNQIMGEISARMDKASRVGSFISHTYAMQQGSASIGSVAISYYTPFFYSENDHQFITTLNTVLIGIGIIASIFAALAVTLLARRFVRPISSTVNAVKQIAQGDYQMALPQETGTIEIDDLASSVHQLQQVLTHQEQLRRRLTTDIAHELRTPLTAVTLYLDTMLAGVWEPTPERLERCKAEMVRLSALVADVGQLAKIEEDTLQLGCDITDLYALARTAMDSFDAQAQQKSLTMTLRGDPVSACVDRERMQQVLVNILSNAIQYTPQSGHIELNVEQDDTHAILRIRDDGIGIAPENLLLIFERFYRTDQSRSRHTGGSGIGLTIAKAIVEAHGGRLTVESTPGQGSCFTILLPKTTA